MEVIETVLKFLFEMLLMRLVVRSHLSLCCLIFHSRHFELVLLSHVEAMRGSEGGVDRWVQSLSLKPPKRTQADAETCCGSVDECI